MRVVVFFLTILTVLLPLRAQEPGQSPQTEAAIADARESLRRQIFSASVASGLTVRELADRTGCTDELNKRIDAAQQIGGTRWLDDQTAQVRLVIEGGAIADILNRAISKDPSKVSVPVEQIRRTLSEWRNRSYAATGTSTGSADVSRLQPPAADVNWNAVPAADRNRALAAARENAVSRLTDSLRPIELMDGKSLGDALAIPEVDSALGDWLANRPVTSVDFRDDLSIRIVLSVPADELWSILHAALSRQKQIPVPSTESGWSLLQKQVESRLAPPVGVGLVQTAKGAPPVEQLMPDFAPDWSNHQMQAEGTAPSRGSKLHTARAAEAIALEKLRGQVEALKLRDNLTIAQAERRDPRIERGVARALSRATPYQVDYNLGSVTVKVTLNLSDVWTMISERK